jgi:hypothetical protein
MTASAAIDHVDSGAGVVEVVVPASAEATDSVAAVTVGRLGEAVAVVSAVVVAVRGVSDAEVRAGAGAECQGRDARQCECGSAEEVMHLDLLEAVASTVVEPIWDPRPFSAIALPPDTHR